MQRRLFVASPMLLAGTLHGDGWAGLMGETTDPLVRTAATAFGTTVSISALAPEGAAEDTRQALHLALQEVQRIDALLSLFRHDSQLSQLNRTGRLDGAHPHLLRNLEFALELGALTAGAFDITVQPLWELFAQAQAQGRLPGRKDIAQTRRRVDYRAVRIDGDRVLLEQSGTRVTLNSLAQGYAVDVVLDLLRRHGVQAALIDTGEIGNLGRRERARPWAVGVQHPRDREACIAFVGMDGRVLSTSGDYATRFSEDFRYHHIFDPASGVSPPEFSSTIAFAESGIVADGISTALMLLDRGAGEALLAAFAGSDALWIDKHAQLSATPGVPFLDS